jgi:WD40 repeat protein
VRGTLFGAEPVIRIRRFIPACAGRHPPALRLWDVTNGAETARLEGHTKWVAALCALPDGRLTSGSGEWDVTTGAETARLEATRDLPSLSPLPDGLLTSACSDNTIRLWDVPGRCEVTRFEIDVYVRCLASLSDSRLVAGDVLGRLHWLEIVV